MNETQYFRLPLRERLKARAPRQYHTPGPVFTKPSPNPKRDQKTFWIEAGHGLRVEPARKYLGDSRSYSPEWHANEYEDTVVAHIIRLPKRKGLLVAASDPFNDDCYTVDNVCPPYPMQTRPRIGQQYTFEQANQDAARLACGFAERLAEDYRDDAEHQTALHDYEEALHPLEKTKEGAEARRDEAEQERAQAQALRDFYARATLTGMPEHERQTVLAARDHWQAQVDQLTQQRDAAQDAANDIQDQIDNLEEPRTPCFHYFGKVKR